MPPPPTIVPVYVNPNVLSVTLFAIHCSLCNRLHVRKLNIVNIALSVSPCSLFIIQRTDLPKDALRKVGDPQQLRLPFAITTIRSPKWSASSRSCVMSSMVRPSRYFINRSHICQRAIGSRFLDGSSRIIN